VSLLSRERMQISLSPHHVAMVRLAGWKRLRVLDRKRLSCSPSEAQPTWSAAVEALREMLGQPNPAPATPTNVILSNHFVRYLVLPWSADLVTESEELEFARARFAQVFGDKARQWTIRTSDAPVRLERLAAATDGALIEALARTLSTAGLALASCKPALMAQFNASLRRIGDNAWLVSAEHGRLLIAWIENGRWRSVRVRPLSNPVVQLRDLLEQERVLVSGPETSSNIFVSATDDVVIDTQGLRTEQLVPRSRIRADTPADAAYTLAMAGLP
jgi:hypothetical protein